MDFTLRHRRHRTQFTNIIEHNLLRLVLASNHFLHSGTMPSVEVLDHCEFLESRVPLASWLTTLKRLSLLRLIYRDAWDADEFDGASTESSFPYGAIGFQFSNQITFSKFTGVSDDLINFEHVDVTPWPLLSVLEVKSNLIDVCRRHGRFLFEARNDLLRIADGLTGPIDTFVEAATHQRHSTIQSMRRQHGARLSFDAAEDLYRRTTVQGLFDQIDVPWELRRLHALVDGVYLFSPRRARNHRDSPFTDDGLHPIHYQSDYARVSAEVSVALQHARHVIANHVTAG